MCGRFNLHGSKSEITEEYKLVADILSFPDNYSPCYNIAPSKNILIIHNNSYKLVKWGFYFDKNFINNLTKNSCNQTSSNSSSSNFKYKICRQHISTTSTSNAQNLSLFLYGNATNSLNSLNFKQNYLIQSRKIIINARIEEVEKKTIFKKFLSNYKILIPANGFYEWDKNKQPWYFTHPEDKFITFAGLLIPTIKTEFCVIFTTEANVSVADVHNRMPVVIQKEDFESWLNEDKSFLQFKKKLIMKNKLLNLQKYKVSRKVNKSDYDNFDCICKVE